MLDLSLVIGNIIVEIAACPQTLPERDYSYHSGVDYGCSDLSVSFALAQDRKAEKLYQAYLYVISAMIWATVVSILLLPVWAVLADDRV